MLVRIMFLPFTAVASVGLVLSLVDYVRALTGHQSLLGRGDILPVLGIVVVAIPAISLARRRTLGLTWQDTVRVIYGGDSTWSRIAFTLIFANAFASFVFAVLFIHPGGSVVRGPMPPPVLLVTSAYTLAFYAFSLSLLVPVVYRGRLWRQIRCPRGHRVSSLAGVCPFCGSSVVPDSSAPP